MTLADRAIAAIIDERLRGSAGDLHTMLLKGKDAHRDANLRRQAETSINEMTNVEFLELLSKIME